MAVGVIFFCVGSLDFIFSESELEKYDWSYGLLSKVDELDS